MRATPLSGADVLAFARVALSWHDIELAAAIGVAFLLFATKNYKLYSFRLLRFYGHQQLAGYGVQR